MSDEGGLISDVGDVGSSSELPKVDCVDTLEMRSAVRAGVGRAKLKLFGPGLSFCCEAGKAKNRRR